MIILSESAKENPYIGITEDRMKHIVGVAYRCYEIAKEEGLNEEDCRKAFMYGYLHDVGYAFSTKPSEHPERGYELLRLLGIESEEIKSHGMKDKEQTKYLKILNKADLTIDSKGKKVTVKERLDDIRARYGEIEDAYIKPKELAELLFNTKL